MKRAAAAALALSMALSAAAPAALAKDYYIENGDITVTVTEEGDTYVLVGEAKDKDDIGEKDDTAVVIKGGEAPNKQTENNSDGPADKDTADEAEGQKPVVDAEPGEPAENTGTELIVWPEDAKSGEAQEKDDPEPEEGEPKTPDTQKPVEEAAEDEDDDKDIMTYEANTASTLTKVANEAVQNIIKIINNCTKKDTTVTIENVNIYQYAYDYKAAMSVEGAGDTTLKLVGDNTLRGGHSCAGLEKDDEYSTGKLTITAEDTSASLKAYGGQNSAGIGGGSYDSTSKLEIANGKIYAESGSNMGAGIGGGMYGKGEVTISGGDVTAHGGHTAAGIGGGFRGSGDVTILGGTVTAIPAEGSNSNVTGIGGGEGDVEVEIGGGAQVTAKGGQGDDEFNRGPGAAIGTNGDVGGKAGKELDVNVSGEGTVTRINSQLTTACEHKWTLVSSTPAAVGQLGEKEYKCSSCGSTRTVYKFVLPEPAPVEEEQNGRIVLRVIDAPYEMHQESTRYIVTADSDTATLFGCLGNLAELKEQGVDTLVFRTESRETALDIDTMLSLGAEDTIFTLTHSGSSATLTVGGADHSELIH